MSHIYPEKISSRIFVLLDYSSEKHNFVVTVNAVCESAIKVSTRILHQTMTLTRTPNCRTLAPALTP